MDRAAVITEAKKWLGAKWQHQACVRYQAADCGQILVDIYTQCGLIERPTVESYPKDWAIHNTEERYLAVVEQYAHEVTEPLPGDIAVWKVGRTYSHGAVVIDWPLILHADSTEGVTLADASKGKLAKRDVKFYSIFTGNQ